MVYLFIQNLSGAHVFIIFTLVFGLFVWAIFDILSSKFKSKNAKLLWALLVFLAPVFGPILYLIRRKHDKVLPS
ncbi:PLD nuclease N-terminal domain-containing protein [Echinicola sediminis]